MDSGVALDAITRSIEWKHFLKRLRIRSVLA
jgi:hypothetical protein